MEMVVVVVPIAEINVNVVITRSINDTTPCSFVGG